NVEIGEATTTLPHLAFRVDHRLPFLAAGIGVERDHIIVRRADIDGIADLQRRGLVFRPVAVADRDIAGTVGPGDLQRLHIVAVDLVERGEAGICLIVAIGRPVLLRLPAATGISASGMPEKATGSCGRNMPTKPAMLPTAST